MISYDILKIIIHNHISLAAAAAAAAAAAIAQPCAPFPSASRSSRVAPSKTQSRRQPIADSRIRQRARIGGGPKTNRERAGVERDSDDNLIVFFV